MDLNKDFTYTIQHWKYILENKLDVFLSIPLMSNCIKVYNVEHIQHLCIDMKTLNGAVLTKKLVSRKFTW